MKYLKTYEGLFDFFSKKSKNSDMQKKHTSKPTEISVVDISGDILEKYDVNDILDMLQEISDDYDINLSDDISECRLLNLNEMHLDEYKYAMDLYNISDSRKLIRVSTDNECDFNAYLIDFNYSYYDLGNDDVNDIVNMILTKQDIYDVNIKICNDFKYGPNGIYKIIIYI